jgi:hypothetical protein
LWNPERFFHFSLHESNLNGSFSIPEFDSHSASCHESVALISFQEPREG